MSTGGTCPSTLGTSGWYERSYIQGAEADSILFFDYPAEEYHADSSALSCSSLKPMLTSPAHFLLAATEPARESQAMVFGTLVHQLLLEPAVAASGVAVFPGAACGRDKDWKSFRLTATEHGRVAIDEPTFAAAIQLADKVRSTRYRGRALGSFIEEARCEVTIYFTEPATQLRVRTRLDAMHPDISFDLKTTRHGSPAAFSRSALDLHYDMQAALYSIARRCVEGGASKPFVFIAADSTAPHSVSTFDCGDSFLENGVAKLKWALANFRACSDCDVWPDQGGHHFLEISPWQRFGRESDAGSERSCIATGGEIA